VEAPDEVGLALDVTGLGLAGTGVDEGAAVAGAGDRPGPGPVLVKSNAAPMRTTATAAIPIDARTD
jgi:hypothetical protein